MKGMLIETWLETWRNTYGNDFVNEMMDNVGIPRNKHFFLLKI